MDRKGRPSKAPIPKSYPRTFEKVSKEEYFPDEQTEDVYSKAKQLDNIDDKSKTFNEEIRKNLKKPAKVSTISKKPIMKQAYRTYELEESEMPDDDNQITPDIFGEETEQIQQRFERTIDSTIFNTKKLKDLIIVEQSSVLKDNVLILDQLFKVGLFKFIK